MEQGFPPDAPWRTVHLGAIVLHVIMLALGIVGVWSVIRAGRRPARKSDVWLWTAGCVVSAFTFLAAGDASMYDKISYESRPFVVAYIVFVGFVCGLVTVIRHVRVRRLQRASYATIAALTLFGLGALVFVVLSQVPMARQAARRMECERNMKQIAIALFNFEDAHKIFPRAAAGDPPISWRVATLPFLDGKAFFAQYDQALPWDDPKNEPMAHFIHRELMCPSRRGGQDAHGRLFTDYVMLTGPQTVSPGDRDVRRRDFTDGSANTAMVVEATGLNVVWTEPRDFDTARQPIGINLKGKEPKESPGMMSSYHRAGGHMLMGDGKVRFVSEKIDPRVLRKLTTIDGGENFDDDF